MNINKNQIDIKKCVITAAKWGAGVSLGWVVLYGIATGWITGLVTSVLFTEMPIDYVFSVIGNFFIAYQEKLLLDFAVVSFIAFLVAALMSNRRAVRAAAQPVTQ